MADNEVMTPEENDKNAGVERDENDNVKSEVTEDKYKLEDGTEYKPDDFIKVEDREFHQSTHYLNREISISEIIDEFGDLKTFERGLNFDWHTYHKALEEDKKLADRVQEFVTEHDYDRHEDTWTINKGGFDVETEIVKKFTMSE